jgi:hypothetical protein
MKMQNPPSNLQELLQRNSSPEKQSISTEQGLAAAREISRIAEQENVEHALAGGIAMHLYGFTRATTDVDLIASALLPALQEGRKLSFGGATYQVRLENRVIDVDWIVRDDDRDFVYQAALAGAIETGEGIRIVSPVWMVILKHFAGRGKDEMDLLWLLREPGLVDRELLLKTIRQLFGRFAFAVTQEMEHWFLQADLMRAKDEAGE